MPKSWLDMTWKMTWYHMTVLSCVRDMSFIWNRYDFISVSYETDMTSYQFHMTCHITLHMKQSSRMLRVQSWMCHVTGNEWVMSQSCHRQWMSHTTVKQVFNEGVISDFKGLISYLCLGRYSMSHDSYTISVLRMMSVIRSIGVMSEVFNESWLIYNWCAEHIGMMRSIGVMRYSMSHDSLVSWIHDCHSHEWVHHMNEYITWMSTSHEWVHHMNEYITPLQQWHMHFW